MLEVLNNAQCTFREDRFFARIDNDFEQAILLKEIQTKFFNISRILDCVSCEKCKLNGKLQIKGLGTAMKLLFLKNVDDIQLEKTEIIALVNLFHKLSESLKFY
mmetsp:Transcript_40476/g.38975  ORF Transcript_40476/g.38975 Transcript_40476/m.38975 type:complete len:104 (+) Transcript_40476:847-1158(+)